MLTSPFLTALDPRAAVKGSRDPLGLQPAWTSFGRELVGNLTTVTTSYRNFTSLLLGQYLAEEAIGRRLGGERERCDLFMRAEQLIGYSRVAGREPDSKERDRILGITRITKRLTPASPRLRLSIGSEGMLLGDQKTYGLWGLYSVASRQSGLTEEDVNRPSPAGRELIERHYLPALAPACGKDARKVVELLRENAVFEPRGAHAEIARSIAALHGRRPGAAERRIYDEAIVRGVLADKTTGLQDRLWGRLVELNDDRTFQWKDDFGYEELLEVMKRSRAAQDLALAERLEHVAIVEPVLVAASLLFGLVLDRDGQDLPSVAAEVRKVWGKRLPHLRVAAIEELKARLTKAVGESGAGRLIDLARAFDAGDYAGAVRAALDQNADVMRSRGGSAWVEMRHSKLHVVMRQETAELPPARELPRSWMNPYFINTLKSVGAQVHGKAS